MTARGKGDSSSTLKLLLIDIRAAMVQGLRRRGDSLGYQEGESQQQEGLCRGRSVTDGEGEGIRVEYTFRRCTANVALNGILV